MVKKFSVIMTEQTKNISVIAQKNRSITEKNLGSFWVQTKEK